MESGIGAGRHHPKVHPDTDRLAEQLVDLTGEALKEPAPDCLEFETGLAGLAVNRRRVRLRHLAGSPSYS